MKNPYTDHVKAGKAVRPFYPVARNQEAALTDPITYIQSKYDLKPLIEADEKLSAEVKFTVAICRETFANQDEAERYFERPVSEQWGEIAYTTKRNWTCWISYYKPVKSFPRNSTLSEKERLEIDARRNAKLRSDKAQLDTMNLGLFKACASKYISDE